MTVPKHIIAAVVDSALDRLVSATSEVRSSIGCCNVNKGGILELLPVPSDYFKKHDTKTV